MIVDKYEDYDGKQPIRMDHGFDLILNKNCEYSKRRFYYRIAERQELDFLLPKRLKDLHILDVGANIGYIASFFSTQLNAKFVHCFEPHPESFKILLSNMKNNCEVNKCRAYQYAVGSKSTHANLYINENHSGDHSLNKDNLGRSHIKVQQVSLDDWVLDNNIKNIDILKIDVQGGELDVLMGAQKLINDFDPMLYLEWQDVSDSDAKKFFELCEKFKWELYEVKNNNLSSVSLKKHYRKYNGNLIIPGKLKDALI